MRREADATGDRFARREGQGSSFFFFLGEGSSSSGKVLNDLGGVDPCVCAVERPNRDTRIRKGIL